MNSTKALTNAEKQAAWRERRQQQLEDLRAEIDSKARQLDEAKAERDELQRQNNALAAVIADQRTEQTAPRLFEVIAMNPKKKVGAYGIMFTSEQTADAYAATLKAAGYSVDDYPEIAPAKSLNAALEEAAAFYKDASLAPDGKA